MRFAEGVAGGEAGEAAKSKVLLLVFVLSPRSISCCFVLVLSGSMSSSAEDDNSVAAGDAKADEEEDGEEEEEGVVGIGKGIDLRCSVA